MAIRYIKGKQYVCWRGVWVGETVCMLQPCTVLQFCGLKLIDLIAEPGPEKEDPLADAFTAGPQAKLRGERGGVNN